MENEYLVILITDINDGNYYTPLGIFSGNIFDILYKQVDLSGHIDKNDKDYQIEMYSIENLKNTTEKNFNHEKIEKPLFSVPIGYLNEYYLFHHFNSEFVEKEKNIFKENNPLLEVNITNKIFEVNVKDSILREIENLSPDTLEYIRKNGI